METWVNGENLHARRTYDPWWVPAGRRPGLDEALARLALRRERGDSDEAFGWAWLQEARLWRAKACGAMAAE